jgi:hypothetical protein
MMEARISPSCSHVQALNIWTTHYTDDEILRGSGSWFVKIRAFHGWSLNSCGFPEQEEIIRFPLDPEADGQASQGGTKTLRKALDRNADVLVGISNSHLWLRQLRQTQCVKMQGQFLRLLESGA